MGRRSLSISQEAIETALKGRTITEAARHLGIGRTTLTGRIREMGIGAGRGRYTRRYRRRKKRSRVHQRLTVHSGAVLPADPQALAHILGLTKDEVREYLRRGKRSSERFIREVLSKAPRDLILTSINNDKVPIASINKMSVILDKWGRQVKILITDKQGSVKILHYKVRDLWALLEERM